MSTDDWPKAEALASNFLKNERKAAEPLELHRVEQFPFLIAARWSDGEEYVLVFDGKVQTARGVAALPAYLTYLGEARLRALPVGTVAGLLEILGAAKPTKASVGRLWASGTKSNEDLVPAVVDNAGTLKYVVHFVEASPSFPPGGSKPASNLVLERWSLQLFPVVSNLDWKKEATVERPMPAPPAP
jgi:hypothetical protein